MCSRLSRAIRKVRHDCSKSSGSGASQSNFRNQISCIKIFGITTTGVTQPSGSKSLAVSDTTERLVTEMAVGSDLHENLNRSADGHHFSPSVETNSSSSTRNLDETLQDTSLNDLALTSAPTPMMSTETLFRVRVNKEATRSVINDCSAAGSINALISSEEPQSFETVIVAVASKIDRLVEVALARTTVEAETVFDREEQAETFSIPSESLGSVSCDFTG